MAKTKTSFKPGQNTIRGRSFKSLMLDVCRDESLLDIADPKKATREELEKAFLKKVLVRALNENVDGSTVLLSHVINKSYSNLKQVSPEIELEGFPMDGTAVEKSEFIINAIASGQIPVDLGSTMIDVIKNFVIIEEGTELKDRITEIEKKLGIA